jgi:alcohol dehydrogenase
MRQLTCTGPGSVEWTDAPAPAIEDDDHALIRPIVAARCDIDLMLIAGASADDPFSLGHEGVGVVEALGDGVRGFEIGDVVTLPFQIGCGACHACARGHTGNCERVPLMSTYGMKPLCGRDWGGLVSDSVRVPFASAMLRRVPAGVDPVTIGSVSDNVVDGYRAVAPHLAARPGAEVLIVSEGTTSIGLYAADAAGACGAARVVVASPDAEVRAAATRLGAEAVDTDFRERLGPFPIVVAHTTSPAALTFAVAATDYEGICQTTAFPLEPTPLPIMKMYTKGIVRRSLKRLDRHRKRKPTVATCSPAVRRYPLCHRG